VRKRSSTTARTLVGGDKGLLAMDESNRTCNKRFAGVGIPPECVCQRVVPLVCSTISLPEAT